jgi:mannose-6-phosphate isomerase-like protein (cupin superfamily)
VDIFKADELVAGRDKAVHTYEDFFRSEKLSLGLAVWPAGLPDEQQPHQEDEVYYVIRGRGSIRVADEDQAVEAGTIVFVAAGVEHRFHSIEETLEVLVFWAPPHLERLAAIR